MDIISEVDKDTKITITEHFKGILDKRRAPLHSLHEIFTILICGVICGANDIIGITIWANEKEEWLKSILDLPYGIPSHDTIGRVLSLVDINEFEQCFINWTNAVFKKTKGDIIPIDGKVVRGSHDKSSKVSAINIVGAYSTTNSVLLGQVKTETKSNEITAIPKLLDLLNINECIITIDSMGCQKDIASKIVDKGGDYLLAVKDNQPTLHKEIKEKFEESLETGGQNIEFYETLEKSHGREDTRRYYLINEIDDVEKADDFKSCSAIGMVESIRKINDKVSKEYRYFILSFNTTAIHFAECVRKHWRIENSVHYILDVSFREDYSRIRKKNAASNISMIRRVAMNLIKEEKSTKVGTNNKRLKASANEKYLEKILNFC